MTQKKKGSDNTQEMRIGGPAGYFWDGKQYKKSTGSTNNGAAFSQNGGYIQGSAPLNQSGAYDMSQLDCMKTGGTIHIKKKNLGKFTATKKATGKTTEELTHSSNPVTRKRAVFAQNSKSWKKEDGGLVDYMADGGIPKTISPEDAVLSHYLMQKNLDKNWVQRAYDPNRESIQVPGQPYKSTHLMEYSDNGLQAQVYPSVQQTSNGLQYMGDKSYDNAQDNNEIVQVPLNKAEMFSSYGYKKEAGIPIYKKGGKLRKFLPGGQVDDFDPNSPMVPGGQGSAMSNGPVGPQVDYNPQTSIQQQEATNIGNPGSVQDNPAWRAGMTDEQANQTLTDAQGNPNNVPMPPKQSGTQPIGTGFNNLLGAGLITSSYFQGQRNAKQAASYARNQGMSDNAFAGQKLQTQGNRGDYTQQGVFRPDQMTPTKPGIYYPTMAYGGVIPGTSNQLDTSWYPGFDGNTSQVDPYDRVGRTLPEVPEDMATINAEKQEKILGSFTPDGMPALMNVDGPPHTEGGKNIAAPPNSFVFSDTKDLKIKDPAILKLFGATKTSTPAQLAGKYDLQKFTKVLADDNSDSISRKTAEVMVGNYSNKLNQLGQVQEAIKASKGMDNTFGQPIAKYGGNIPEYGSGGDYDLPTQTVLANRTPRNNYIAPLNELPASPDNSNWQWNGMMPQRTGAQERPVPDYSITPDNIQDTNANTDTLGNTPVNDGNVAYKPPMFTAPTPDKMGIANSMLNLAGIHKYNAWEAPIGAVLPDTTFADPTRALAANSENANTASYNAAISGNAKGARAASLAAQGQAGSTAADIIGRYATENVGTANRASENAASVMNRLQEQQAARSNRLYQGTVTAAQQYDNSLREGRNDLVRQEQHAWDDRQKYDLLNKTSPYFYLDPKTGARVFKSPEAEAAFNNATSGKGQGYSADAAEKVNSIFQRLTKQPAYQSEHGRQEALKLAQRMAGVSEHETTSYDKAGSSKGMKESGIYSGPTENKYGGKQEKRMGGMTNHQLKKFVSKKWGGMTL